MTDFVLFCLLQVEVVRDGSLWVVQTPRAVYSILYTTICTLWLFSWIFGILRRNVGEDGLDFAPMSPTGDIGMRSNWDI